MHTLAQLRAGQLVGCRRLDLAADLTDFPTEILALADSLEVLNLSHNRLSCLPDAFACLQQLRVLFLSDNAFTELPAVLGRLPHLRMLGIRANRVEAIVPGALAPSLRWLILTDNCLRDLPADIGACRGLRKLMLAGNQLSQLPVELGRCRELELLRLSANRLESLPDWLLELPQLRWLALGGNPCSPAPAATQAVAIDWAALCVYEQLGEGASGQIFRADWQDSTGRRRPVALKLFKGRLGSDGLPECELATSLQAGHHPHLPEVLGRLQGHPAGRDGLVLGLIAPEFGNLAGPPSLQTCTRDVYPADSRYSLAQLWRLARGTAAALVQLHGCGLIHGDIYAHNLLWRTDGQVLLSDFGAASCIGLLPCRQQAALHGIEAAAFGCLLDELLAHCADGAGLPELAELARDCQQSDPCQRPPLATVLAKLDTLAAGCLGF